MMAQARVPPRREAIRLYREAIPLADERFTEHLMALEAEEA